MSPKQPSKSFKRTIWLPVLVLALLLAAWSVYWALGAAWLKQQVHQEIARYQVQGVEVSFEHMQIGGWPYRFAVTMRELRVATSSTDQELEIFIPTMHVHAMAWNLSHLIVEIPQHAQAHTNGGQSWVYTSERTRASLVLQDGSLSRLSIELVAPQLDTSTGQTAFRAEQLEVHIRPGSQPNSRNIFSFVTKPLWPAMPVQDIKQIRGQGEVFSWDAFMGTNSLHGFRDAGGHLVLDEGLFETSSSSVHVSGNLQIDENGFAKGRLKTNFIRPAALLSGLDQTQLDSDTRKAIAAISLLTGGIDEANVSFQLKKGAVYSGPFRLARLPALIH